MSIRREDLEAAVDMQAADARVTAVLEAAAGDLSQLLRFVARYTSWNGLFGAGVATLAGKIARSRGVFVDAEVPVRAVADRSVLVASHFFDAAIDEFDDRSTRHRDSHRCLAQATLLGVLDWCAEQEPESLADLQAANALLAEPDWLLDLNQRVGVGYGHGSDCSPGELFRSMGYHLGSELLADEEFTRIDAVLRARRPELVRHLESARVEVGGERHEAWKWVRVHSGHGGGAEADHFDWAVQGVERAFDVAPAGLMEELRGAVIEGFRGFERDHQLFFARVLEPAQEV